MGCNILTTFLSGQVELRTDVFVLIKQPQKPQRDAGFPKPNLALVT